jgi:hypothetical protein
MALCLASNEAHVGMHPRWRKPQVFQQPAAI